MYYLYDFDTVLDYCKARNLTEAISTFTKRHGDLRNLKIKKGE